MDNNKQVRCNEASNDEYDSISTVEQIYPVEMIDNAECVNSVSSLLQELPFDPQQLAANDAFAYADVYSLNSARMAKHNRSSERRSSKSKLTDRRSSARLCANGEVQQDRRADNRAANVESIRASNSDNSEEPRNIA